MKSADAQVINMVNAPHERREQQKERRRQAKRRQKIICQSFLRLVIKLELCAVVAGLLIIAALHGWIANWMETVGVSICIAGGGMVLGKYMEWWRHG